MVRSRLPLPAPSLTSSRMVRVYQEVAVASIVEERAAPLESGDSQVCPVPRVYAPRLLAGVRSVSELRDDHADAVQARVGVIGLGGHDEVISSQAVERVGGPAHTHLTPLGQ